MYMTHIIMEKHILVFGQLTYMNTVFPAERGSAREICDPAKCTERHRLHLRNHSIFP